MAEKTKISERLDENIAHMEELFHTCDDIKKKRIDYRRKQDYSATYEKCPDGSYDVILKIVEPTKTTLEVKLNVMTRSLAKFIEKSWQEKAPTVYSKISEILMD